MSASVREALLEVREASWMSGCDRETLPNVPDGLEALLDVRQLSKALPVVREWAKTLPKVWE